MTRRAAGAVLVAMLLAGGAAGASTRARPPDPKRGFSERYEAGRAAAVDLAKLTGVAMTPLLGATVLGAQAWLQSTPRERARLPWYQQPSFFVPGILVILVLWLGHRLPVISRLAKLLTVWEDKIVAAFAIPIVADSFASAVSRPLAAKLAFASDLLLPSAHAASAGGGLLADATGTVSHALAWTAGVLVGAIVWLASHAINVLVLVSPFPLVDWMLKGLRALMLGLLVAAAMSNPWLGVAVSAVYILVGALLAGWTFRLLVFEIVFSRDLLGRRWNRPFRERPLRVFASSGLRGVRPRTLGTLEPTPDGLAFRFRPWLVGRPRHVALPPAQALAVGRGMLGPVLLEVDPERDAGVVLARFPPRYRLDTRRLARVLGSLRVEDATAPVGSPGAWLGEAVGRRPVVRPVTPVQASAPA